MSTACRSRDGRKFCCLISTLPVVIGNVAACPELLLLALRLAEAHLEGRAVFPRPEVDHHQGELAGLLRRESQVTVRAWTVVLGHDLLGRVVDEEVHVRLLLAPDGHQNLL